MSAVGSMGGRGHGLESDPHSSAILLWDNRLTSLSLGFLICKMGVWSRGGDWVEDAPWLVSGRLPSGTEMTQDQRAGPDEAPSLSLGPTRPQSQTPWPSGPLCLPREPREARWPCLLNLYRMKAPTAKSPLTKRIATAQ